MANYESGTLVLDLRFIACNTKLHFNINFFNDFLQKSATILSEQRKRSQFDFFLVQNN